MHDKSGRIRSYSACCDIWFWSTLFAHACLYEYIRRILFSNRGQRFWWNCDCAFRFESMHYAYIARRAPDSFYIILIFRAYVAITLLEIWELINLAYGECMFLIASLGEDRANLSAFRTFVRFVLVLGLSVSLPLGVWEGLRFLIVALPGLFSYILSSVRSRLFLLIIDDIFDN